MGNPELSEEYIINTSAKGRRNSPKESGRIAREKGALQESVDPRLGIRAEYLRTARTILKNENYSGRDVITVSPDKDDVTTLYIESRHAKIFVDLSYSDEYESTDSLRNNKKYHPDIQITAMVGADEYSISCETMEDAARISGEVLKQIERIKNPNAFGYEEIGFTLGENREILLFGRKSSGEVKRLSFLQDLDVESRLILFSFLSHYFSKKIDPKLLKDPEEEEEGEEAGFMGRRSKKGDKEIDPSMI